MTEIIRRGGPAIGKVQAQRFWLESQRGRSIFVFSGHLSMIGDSIVKALRNGCTITVCRWQPTVSNPLPTIDKSYDWVRELWDRAND